MTIVHYIVVSDCCCLMPNELFFSYIMVIISYITHVDDMMSGLY